MQNQLEIIVNKKNQYFSLFKMRKNSVSQFEDLEFIFFFVVQE